MEVGSPVAHMGPYSFRRTSKRHACTMSLFCGVFFLFTFTYHARMLGMTWSHFRALTQHPHAYTYESTLPGILPL